MDESYFDQKGLLDKQTSTMRLLHYSAEKSGIDRREFAAGAHSDWGFMTLLIIDDVPGLQICRNKDAVPQVWEKVPPMNGVYILNLGQLLERWSNGLFRATLHRVIGTGVDRYSVPFFLEPSFDWVVECLPTCSETNPPKYPPIKNEAFLVNKIQGDSQERVPWSCVAFCSWPVWRSTSLSSKWYKFSLMVTTIICMRSLLAN